MTNPDKTEDTAGGLTGKIAGKAKEAAGAVLGDEQLAREGRLQQSQVDAETDAAARGRRGTAARGGGSSSRRLAWRTKSERERLANEVAAEDREAAIERETARVKQQAQAVEQRETKAAQAQQAVEQYAAASAEQEAEAKRIAEEQAAERLEQEARRAEARADAIDPEEN